MRSLHLRVVVSGFPMFDPMSRGSAHEQRVVVLHAVHVLGHLTEYVPYSLRILPLGKCFSELETQRKESHTCCLTLFVCGASQT